MASLRQDLFLAATGRNGFCSFYDTVLEDDSPYCVTILKGCSGGGKSTAIKAVAQRLMQRGYAVELIHCASDPQSLDGVLCHEKRLAVIDGTAPHTADPAYPAVRDNAFSLYECVDRGALGDRLEQLMLLSGRSRALRQRSARFIAAAAELLEDIGSTAAATLDTARFETYIKNLGSRLFPKGRRGAGPGVMHRFAGAVTPEGLVDHLPRCMQYCSTRILLSDPYGEGAHRGAALLLQRALEQGFAVTVMHDPIFPEKCEGFIVREASVAVAVSGTLQQRRGCGRGVHLQRFYKTEDMPMTAAFTKFCRKSALSLLDQASQLMDQARDLHLQTEDIYASAINFKKLEQAQLALLRQLGLA